MPLTPFHAGYPLIAGILARNWFSIPAALIGSVIIDLEPLARILLGMSSHGPFHSFLGALIVGLLLGMIVFVWRKRFDALTSAFGIKQKTSVRSAFTGALFGTFSHIVLDITMHHPDTGFRALWPFSNATFYQDGAPEIITLASIGVLILALALYVIYAVKESHD